MTFARDEKHNNLTRCKFAIAYYLEVLPGISIVQVLHVTTEADSFEEAIAVTKN